MDFLNQVAVVTGAGRGIGRAIALAFAQDGADLAIVDIVKDDINGVVREVDNIGRQSLGLKCDIRNKSEVEQTAKAIIDKFNKVDILVNVAGTVNSSATEDLAEEDWDKVINVNLKGTFLCCQAFGKEMIKRGKGKIVNIASAAGHVGIPQRIAYCSSKGGVLNLTRALAVEWAKFGINVNSVSPGRTETPMLAQMKNNIPGYAERESRIPMKHSSSVEDIANAVIFLASSKAKHITGRDILVDGGILAIHPMFT